MTSHAAVLQGWAQEGKLSEAKLSADGTELTLDGVTLPGSEKITVEYQGKSCVYTLGSIFLQIIDQNQSLMAYRNKAKSHQISDSVSAKDKPTIIGYFLSSSEAGSGTGADGAQPAGARPPAVDDSKGKESGVKDGDQKRDKEHKKERHEKHRGRDKGRDKSSSSSSHKRERSSSRSGRDQSTTPKEKRTKETKLDPEMMMSSLSAVAGRREIEPTQAGGDAAQQEALKRALSTEGFDVITPEIIEDYKRVTESTMAHEIPVGNSSSILKAAAGKDLSRILKLYNETINESNRGRSSSGSGRKESSSSSSSKPHKKSWKQYLVGKNPIIILPKGMTAPLTITNGHEFFANSTFVPRKEMIAKLRAEKKDPQKMFSREVNANITGRTGKVQYELMDNPRSKLHRKEDWDRVVAVVALGEKWQFKDWPAPYFKEPVQLFGRTFGFYVGFEGDKVPADAQSWSVMKATLSRDKRGLDRVTYATFWSSLDEWMTIHKPEMLPRSTDA